MASSDRGAALISILLLLIIMSALSAALTISTRTEVMVAKNRQSAAQARAAAEAGLNHAAEVTLGNIQQWNAQGFASPSAAMTRLLRGPDDQVGTTARDADNGSLENLGIPRPPARLGLNNLPGVGYEARLFDEDDPGRGLTLSALDRTWIQEDNTGATTDGNSTILVRSIGYANDGTQLTLEATITKIDLPAILTDGDLTVTGNATVAGLNGSVHSNEDLTVWGSAFIADDATSTGTYSQGGGSTVGGSSGGGLPTIPINPVSAASYRNDPTLDFVLESDGRVTHPTTGALLCNGTVPNNCNAVLGVRWTYSGPGWNIAGGGGSSAGITFGTYYVEGPVNITSNPGNLPANPVEITIIAEGSIDISGNPDLTPSTPGLMFVTDGDLRIGGNLDMAPPPPSSREGQILVREQFEITGNCTLYGQITADNAATNSNLVTANSVTGSTTITYNSLNSTNTFTVGAWREVR